MSDKLAERQIHTKERERYRERVKKEFSISIIIKIQGFNVAATLWKTSD